LFALFVQLQFHDHDFEPFVKVIDWLTHEQVTLIGQAAVPLFFVPLVLFPPWPGCPLWLLYPG
jgi:hypothetical protein